MTDRPDQPATKRKRRRATTPPGHTATAPATVGQGAQVETVSAAAGPAKRRAPRKRTGKAAAEAAAAAETATSAERTGAEPANAVAEAVSAEAVGAAGAPPEPLPIDEPAADPGQGASAEAGEDLAKRARNALDPASGPASEIETEAAAQVEAVAQADVVAQAEVAVAAVAHAPPASGEAAAVAVTEHDPSPIDGDRDRHRDPAPDPDRAEADRQIDAPQAADEPLARAQAEPPQASTPTAQGADDAPAADAEDAAESREPGSPEPQDAEPPVPPHDPHHRHGWVYAAMAVFALSLLFGAWGVWTTWLAGDEGDPQDVASLSGRIERLNQEVSTLRRSDQISRDANRDLQRTLAERDEEIAGLRADVAFYERFVGATGQRRGLSVHDLEMQLQSGEAWHFVATLTQNLNRGAVNTGRLTLSVEGTRNERMERLSWTQLRRQNNPPGAPYSFKYFQQVEGDVLLPKDFKPVRVIVRLTPAGGAAVEQSFTWNETQDRSPTP